jgi:hypothetical protein
MAILLSELECIGKEIECYLLHPLCIYRHHHFLIVCANRLKYDRDSLRFGLQFLGLNDFHQRLVYVHKLNILCYAARFELSEVKEILNIEAQELSASAHIFLLLG